MFINTKNIFILAAAFALSSCTALKQKNTTIVENKSVEEQKRITGDIIDAKRQQIAGMPDVSIAMLQSIILQDSLNATAHYELAQNYITKKNTANAVNHAKTAYEIDKNNFWYAALYAQTLSMDNNFKEAWAIYQTMLNLWCNKIELWQEVFIFLEGYQKYDILSKTLELYEKKFGYSNEIILMRYQIYVKEGKIKKAEEYLIKTIGKNKETIVFHLFLGEHYISTGKIQKASETYDNALKIDKNNPDALLGKVRVYLFKKEYNNVYDMLASILANPNVNADVKIGIYVTLAQESEINKAINRQKLSELLESLYNQYNTNPEIRYLHGNVKFNEGDMKQAVFDFSYSLSEKPDNLQLWLFTLYILEQEKEHERLIQVADSAIMYFPSQKDLFIARGFGHLQLKDYEKSLADFNFALRLTGNSDKDRSSVLHFLGEVSFQMGNDEEAYKYYEDILKIDNNDIVALNNYAYYLSVRNRDLEKALEMSLKTVKIEPTNSTYLDTYAYILFQLKKYTDALKYIEFAIKNGGTHSGVILEHYGDILYMNGQLDFAVSTWKEAKEAGETSELIDKKIETGKYVSE